MTYIVAWKRQGVIYLCADSAVTTHDADPLHTSEETTFGQQVINDPNRQVIESGLKIIHLGSAIAAYAGEINVGSRVLLALRDELIHQSDLATAVSQAISDTVSADEAGRIKLVAAVPSGNGATGVFFNADGHGKIETMIDDHVLRLGSMPHEFRKLSSEGVVEVTTRVDVPSHQLACVLALLQSLGVNNNLIAHGVGGAFCGAYVTGSSIHWQDDILYSVVEPGNYWTGAVETAIRDNILVVKSQLAKRVSIIGNRLAGTALDTWWAKWHSYVHEHVRFGKCGYIAFLTKRLPKVTIVEMQGDRASRDLILPTELLPIETNGQRKAEFTMSPELMLAVTSEPPVTSDGKPQTTVTFFGFEPAHVSTPHALPIA